MQVAYVVPSSPMLIKRVLKHMDFSGPRIIVEFGPGEGCYTREILKQMHPESRLLLFEIDEEFVQHLQRQFRHEPRVEIVHDYAQNVSKHLAERGMEYCDYVISGIPFSYIDVPVKQALVQSTFDALAPEPHAAFIIYQVTNELKAHARQFPRVESRYCLQNFPPMVVTAFYKQPLNGHANGHRHGHPASHPQPHPRAAARAAKT
jgi:phospholipid N-methyltransferase